MQLPFLGLCFNALLKILYENWIWFIFSTEEVRTVKVYEIGRVFFWMGFSCDSDIHISLEIGLNRFMFSQLI